MIRITKNLLFPVTGKKISKEFAWLSQTLFEMCGIFHALSLMKTENKVQALTEPTKGLNKNFLKKKLHNDYSKKNIKNTFKQD